MYDPKNTIAPAVKHGDGSITMGSCFFGKVTDSYHIAEEKKCKRGDVQGHVRGEFTEHTAAVTQGDDVCMPQTLS